LGTKFDNKKPELATVDGQKNMGSAKIREGRQKKVESKEKKEKKGQGKKREFTRAR
jgi:hypothetical protein